MSFMMKGFIFVVQVRVTGRLDYGICYANFMATKCSAKLHQGGKKMFCMRGSPC